MPLPTLPENHFKEYLKQQSRAELSTDFRWYFSQLMSHWLNHMEKLLENTSNKLHDILVNDDIHL